MPSKKSKLDQFFEKYGKYKGIAIIFGGGILILLVLSYVAELF